MNQEYSDADYFMGWKEALEYAKRELVPKLRPFNPASSNERREGFNECRAKMRRKIEDEIKKCKIITN